MLGAYKTGDGGVFPGALEKFFGIWARLRHVPTFSPMGEALIEARKTRSSCDRALSGVIEEM
jgi:hypothetical protein